MKTMFLTLCAALGMTLHNLDLQAQSKPSKNTIYIKDPLVKTSNGFSLTKFDKYSLSDSASSAPFSCTTTYVKIMDDALVVSTLSFIDKENDRELDETDLVGSSLLIQHNGSGVKPVFYADYIYSHQDHVIQGVVSPVKGHATKNHDPNTAQEITTAIADLLLGKESTPSNGSCLIQELFQRNGHPPKPQQGKAQLSLEK